MVAFEQSYFDGLQYRAVNFAFKAARKVGLTQRAVYNLELVAYLRHVQHLREVGKRKNPDSHVGLLLSRFENQLARVENVNELRANPLYHYVLARTKCYDAAFEKAIEAGAKQIILIGVGMDTRSFRYQRVLDKAGVKVIETDLEPWVSERARRSRKLNRPRDLAQLRFNLEQDDFAVWAKTAGVNLQFPTAVFAEGVTPYISNEAYVGLLDMISKHMPIGSMLFYDAKYQGLNNDIGFQTRPHLFRMPQQVEKITDIHRQQGLLVKSIASSADVQKQYADYDAPVFEEDVVIEASIRPLH